MSTYNGSKYISEQVDSILGQDDVDIHLSIRDDGSKDDTVNVIGTLIEKYPGKITLYKGKNVGYRKSFLKLLSLAQEAEFYGFSDQDDYWKPEKVKVALKHLETLDSEIKLYVSSTINVNEKMQQVGIHDMSKVIPTIESAFTRNRYTGCTFIFSKELKDISARFSDLKVPHESMPAHDFVLIACALACGKVYYDSQSYIYHIRREESVTTGGNGLIKRLRTEYNGIFHRKHMSSNTAGLLLEKCENEIVNDAKGFLGDASNCNANLRIELNL